MNIVGIIAEYNPFHNGHLYHLNRAKELSNSDYSVAIMSSNFVQRGEPSIFTKWQRSEIAVRNGVDLVLELPVLYSSRSAYYFAYGAIYSFDKSNVISHLAFGSEHSDLDELSKISEFLAKENLDFKTSLKKYLKKGLSYPKSRENALKEFFPEITFNLNQPNVILGLNYLKVLKELDSKIHPLPIKRIGGYHSIDPIKNIAGATLIRNLIKDKESGYQDFLTEETNSTIKNILKKGFEPVFLDNFSSQIMYMLRKKEKEDFLKYPGVTEGLENKIVTSLLKGNNPEEIINSMKSKRYTETRIRRILIEILLGITSEYENKNPDYLRVLAFNEKGRRILKNMKEKSSLPIITKFADFYQRASSNSKLLLDLEISTTNIYTQVQKKEIFNLYNQDFTNSPYFHV